MTMNTFRFYLLFLFAVSAMGLMQRGGAFKALSVTRVDQLEVLTTTDAAGVVTARSGVRFTTPGTGPTITAGSGAPASSAPRGSIYLRTDLPVTYQNSDGASAWAQATSPTPNTANTTLEIVDNCSAGPSGTVNLTTEGTIDWLYLGGTTIPTATQGHSKLGGPGWLRRGFWWVFAGGGIGFTSQINGIAFTTTASDDAANSALTAATDRGRMDGTVGATPATGYGWNITVPASPYQTRLLRVYMGSFSNTVTFTATLQDGTTAPVTASRVMALNAGNNFMCSVKYRSVIPVDLVVTVRVTAVNSGSSSTSLSGMAQTISIAP